jgi:hypothetical protein
MNTQTVRTAPRSPWQNAYAERVIGSIRRECLDHVIAINETAAAAGPHPVHCLLHGVENAPCAQEGRACHTTGHATIGRPDRRDRASRRAPSPLRSRGGLIVRRCLLAPDISSVTDLQRRGRRRRTPRRHRPSLGTSPLHNRTCANYADATIRAGPGDSLNAG